MRFLLDSIKCWFLRGGHVWQFESMTVAVTGKATVMRCVKCGAKTMGTIANGK